MNSQKEKLFSKHGIAAKQIARMLLTIQEGQRLPRIDDLVIRFDLSRGTAQGAIRLLENMNAVQLESRGHLGTFLVEKNQPFLWEIADMGAVIGMMPLPYSKRYEGLATGLVEGFEQVRIPFYISHVRGANYRIEAVQSRRCDFAVVSLWSAKKACERYPDLSIIQNLGINTFVRSHGILFADQEKNKMSSGMRVGIDLSSLDQRDLTYAECNQLDVEFVELNYMKIFHFLESGQIDAAIWNLDEVPPSAKWGIGTFRSQVAKEMNHTLSQAAILTHSKNQEVSSILETISVQQITQIQQQVLEGKKLPHY